jgi:hypothetical protein
MSVWIAYFDGDDKKDWFYIFGSKSDVLMHCADERCVILKDGETHYDYEDFDGYVIQKKDYFYFGA